MSQVVSLSEAVSIALHGMILIAKSESKLNAQNIADSICSSRHHVAKVFQRLVKNGFVSSNRGPSGGFILKRAPEEIALLDIYEAIEGTIDVEGCSSNKETCPFSNCIMGDLSCDLAREFQTFFARKTLKDYTK